MAYVDRGFDPFSPPPSPPEKGRRRDCHRNPWSSPFFPNPPDNSAPCCMEDIGFAGPPLPLDLLLLLASTGVYIHGSKEPTLYHGAAHRRRPQTPPPPFPLFLSSPTTRASLDVNLKLFKFTVRAHSSFLPPFCSTRSNQRIYTSFFSLFGFAGSPFPQRTTTFFF